jgi:hypothetical protein
MQHTLPSFSLTAKSLVPGSLFEHYSGKKYKFLSIARHSETLEELAIYQALYGENDVWVRPLLMFLENVTINGIERPRFKLIS